MFFAVFEQSTKLLKPKHSFVCLMLCDVLPPPPPATFVPVLEQITPDCTPAHWFVCVMLCDVPGRICAICANAAVARLDPIINAPIPAAIVAMKIILVFVCTKVIR
jgi:hypothetical protein